MFPPGKEAVHKKFLFPGGIIKGRKGTGENPFRLIIKICVDFYI